MSKREKGSAELAVLVVLILLLVGFVWWLYAERQNAKNEAKATVGAVSNRQVEIGGTEFVLTEIDGCEYFFSPSGPYRSAILTHKGDCKNPIHYGRLNAEEVKR